MLLREVVALGYN